MSLINYEWKLLRSGYSFYAVILLFTAIGIYGVWNGLSWNQFQELAIETALQEEIRTFTDLHQAAEQIEYRTDLDPASDHYSVNPGIVGLFYSRPAAMPPAPLAATSIGQSDIYPYLFDVTAHRKDAFIHQEEMDNPNNLLLGRFDLSFVIVYLVPLLIVGLTFNIISGERERNTWKLLLSQPVSIYRLASIKLLLRGLTVAFIVTMLFLVALAAKGSGASISLIAIWIAAVLIYVFFWLLLSLVVNTYNSTSASNGLVLICIWIVLVLIVPASVHLTAEVLHPVPSRSILIEETRQAETEVRVDPAGLLEEWYAENPEKRPENFDPDRYNFSLWWMAIQREVDRRLDPLVSEYDNALESQYRFVSTARLLSPAVLMQEVLNELAGSGYSRYRHFMDQVERFHLIHIDYFAPRTFAQQRVNASDYDDFPRFEFEEEPASRPAIRALTGTAGILGWSMVLFVTGMFTIRRLRSLE